MNDFSTYEYVVSEKMKGVKTLKRLGLILLYTVFVVAWFVFGFVTHLFPLLALMPVTLWMLVFFTWRYVQVEYEYSITSGEITLSNIYGGRSKRTLCTFPLKSCATIAPLTEKYDYLIDRFAPEKTVNCLSGEDSEDAYFMLADIGGKRAVVYVEATEKFLRLCRFYNASATTVSKVRF